MSAFPTTWAIVDDLGDREEPRTALQSGAPGRLGIDRESNVIVLEGELDRPPGRGKTVGFSDEQHTGPTQAFENPRIIPALGGAYEHHLAMPCLSAVL